MPRYFFHVRNSIGLVHDEEGRELPSLEAARGEGIRGVRSILSDDVKQGRIDLRGDLAVTDEAGTELLRLRFDQAVELHLGDDP